MTKTRQIILFFGLSLYAVLVVAILFFWRGTDGLPKLSPDQPSTYLLFLPLAIFIILVALIPTTSVAEAKAKIKEYELKNPQFRKLRLTGNVLYFAGLGLSLVVEFFYRNRYLLLLGITILSFGYAYFLDWLGRKYPAVSQPMNTLQLDERKAIKHLYFTQLLPIIMAPAIILLVVGLVVLIIYLQK